MADTIQDAAEKWNERRYNQKFHPDLERIAKRLGEMNRPEHDPVFRWEDTYDTDPPYWRVSDTVIKILNDYDRTIRNVFIRVANLMARIKDMIAEDFDEDLESWEGAEEEPDTDPDGGP